MPGSPERVIDRAARKLAASGGDIDALDFAEKKAVLELLWRRRGPWIAREPDIEAWLRWAGTDWKPRIAETRVCMALLRHYDPELPVAGLSQSWLSGRAGALWGRFGDFARTWRLWEGVEAVARVAGSLAAGDLSFLRDGERAAQTRPILQGSGFLVAVAENYALRAAAAGDWTAAGSMLDFFEPAGLLGAGGPAAARARAKIAFVSGLVGFGARSGAETIGHALKLAFRIAGDPRAGLEDWRDIPEDVLAQVERWLAADTLEAAFRIVADLRTDEPDALARRRAFWRAFLPFVTRARLIGARKAQSAAVLLHAPCSSLSTYLSDHCGFLLELRGPDGRDLVVLELNNLAQSLFWPGDDPRAPGFDQRAYDGGALRAKCDRALSHLPPQGWEEKFAQLIAQETGIVLPAFSSKDFQ
ncbi:EH signature domain-containing protein [Candidatus Rhodoblastus alkanivorans]|uniref:Zorya protein ZorC EH domain-containing protein n=1 Tax=Candidatus Rhodoblastus alkanivorans TaxID=2954117 RepID=A0ABS9Z737_9HYPH|nr:EH signature domain-containing protein [Candidatus Rhodoblastus alkanivorans]MCI4683484.1 hypothetical protein [Candidatus Rhodoblastus alkanivorans]